MDARTPLEHMCAGNVDEAVAEAVHRADPREFHKRVPKGRCPWCTLAQNMLALQDIDMKAILQRQIDLQADQT